MKRKILITLLTVALLCGTLLGASMLSAGAEGTPIAEEGHVHTSENYINGFRECCGAYQPAITVTNENYEALGLAATYVGYVAIENAGQLYWFAAEAEAGNHLDAVLLAHVTINDVTFALENGTPAAKDKNGNAVALSTLRKWTSIGKEASVTSAYNKTFDGNGYEIRGLYCEESSDHVGLFGVASGFKIKNLGMINSCIVANGTTYYTGSFVGLAYNGTLQNCYSNALIKANSFTGGIVGCPSPSVTLSIYSCYYFGTMYASIGSSSFGSDYYFSCAIVSTANQKPIISNCYYLEGSSIHGNDGTKAIGAQDLTSGRLAFLLGAPYGQNIDNGGENAGHPTLDAAPVNYGYNSCDPTDLPLYSNAPITMEKAAHDFSVPLHDGSKACSKCQSYQRQHSSISAEYEESTDARQTHLIVKYPVTNPAAIRRDTAVITLNCSLTSHQDVTLGLFNGRVATKNGEELSFGAQNSVGY
ncbi:MAG: hypothetical protein IJW22_06460, partial [Clostridia bacterium]|nr:hypothetical protein [Clostridia bacterium]